MLSDLFGSCAIRKLYAMRPAKGCRITTDYEAFDRVVGIVIGFGISMVAIFLVSDL